MPIAISMSSKLLFNPYNSQLSYETEENGKRNRRAGGYIPLSELSQNGQYHRYEKTVLRCECPACVDNLEHFHPSNLKKKYLIVSIYKRKKATIWQIPTQKQVENS